MNNISELLDQISSPDDLRRLSVAQLPELCAELRRDIVDELSVNPGHLASSLGVVELTVALHYVFSTPYDRIVWDVGHQAYGHKILTGRKDTFCTNRKLHGIRPFPTPMESEYDTFTCGHASNSISAALGMAVAARKTGHDDRHVVAVIGDGAMSGGLAFEGLNNVSSSPNDLLIVLNDNDMSIDRAVGGMEKYLLNLDTNATYNRLRDKASKWLHSMGYLNDDRRKGIIRLNNALKSALSHQQNVFEGMIIRYFGPLDGNDVSETVRILEQLKNMRGPKLLHLHTVKGKGYEPAEREATVWHAPGKFNKDTGEILSKPSDQPHPLKFQDVFGKTIVELAQADEKVVGITAAMPTGCSLTFLQEAFPKRAFDVGIAEEHAVTFAGGLAKDGLKPYCCIYSSFLQRAYDEIIHDVALQNLSVVFCIDRAGLVGEDGATHHGAFDLAYLNCIPNMIVSSPIDEHSLRNLLYTSNQVEHGPFAIRYPRGGGKLVDWHNDMQVLPIGKGRKLSSGERVAVLSIGPFGSDVAEAVAKLRSEGVNVAHYDMIFLKPIDEAILEEVGKMYHTVITVEDGTIRGGLGSTVVDWFNDHGYSTRVYKMGIPDEFICQGTVAQLRDYCGIGKGEIKNRIKELFYKTV